MRIKRPDKKNALSILQAARREMEFTQSLEITEQSGSTIIRNIYECFRMLGDSLLISKGIETKDHLEPIKELTSLKVKTDRPIRLVDNLRRLRHSINYYGYKPSTEEVREAKAIAKSLFKPLESEVKRRIA